MNKTALGVFCIALASLLLELNLIRVFDVLWYPNMAYMIITLAVFSFGLAGVYLSLKPVKNHDDFWLTLTVITIIAAGWISCMQWAIDRLPFDYLDLAGDEAGAAALNFFLIYIVICVPFFLAGLVLSMVFTHYANQIRSLYFWDLIGAALGSVLLIPLLPKIGTTGTMIVVSGLCLCSAFCFSINKNKSLTIGLAVAALVVIVGPFTNKSIDTFEPHMHKRAFKPLSKEISEGTWWDPISKIDILNTEILLENRKWIAYDGGTQSSYFFRFDGDFVTLRDRLEASTSTSDFWNKYVAVSHFVKADSDAEVLIIGSAGGQELKAALTYNAASVDAIELVGTVVALGKTQYADYIGDIMNDPRANVLRGEGRSYLRQLGKTYDIIQMFSNHTSSSIAAGSGSMQSAYLQTVEAYMEYFTHLSSDGILHINHHVYPKMVATAAQAWKRLGRSDFRQHVIVSDTTGVQDNLPTLMIKMTPWTAQEVAKIKGYMPNFDYPVDPMNPSDSFLSDDFFIGKLPQEIIDKAPYRIEEPTDNRPFFNSLRTTLKTLPSYDADVYVNESISELLNNQKSTGFPIDVMHLLVTTGAAIVFALLFTFGPLLFAKTGREKWPGKTNFMVYFSCLGLGFIVLELVFIQIFMKIIGYPLYTYTIVLFTFLFGAGIGSLMSEKMRLLERGLTWVPFVGVIAGATFAILCQQFLFDSLLELRTIVRMLASVAVIFPVAFFLGMPFPMGVLTIEHKPTGTVAWAWALNGLFTVAGGIFCAVFSVYFGFIATVTVSMLAYVLAFFMFRALYRDYQSNIA